MGHNLEIKVGDFGLAVKLNFPGERRSSTCGTPNYMAPEQLAPQVGHSFEADVWALGVTIFYLLTGTPPFGIHAKSLKQLYKNINDVNYTWPKDVKLSDNAKDLISRILVKKDAQRLTLQEI